MTAALVHGFGESAYYYWAADLVCHDTNLTAEVIRRVLLRIDDLNKLKEMSRCAYLQLVMQATTKAVTS